jgi:hypothetical protein
MAFLSKKTFRLEISLVSHPKKWNVSDFAGKATCRKPDISQKSVN